MGFTDFEYDGIRLSRKGYILCYFNGLQDQVSNGSEIEFAQVPLQHGVRQAVAGTSYGSVIQATFCICKDPCYGSSYNQIITTQEVRDIARWLTRKEYLPCTFLSSGYSNITYFATFEIEQIRGIGGIIGLQLTMTTNSPFGWQDEVTYTATLGSNGVFVVDDISDEVGSLFVRMNITCKSSGTMTIHNSMDNNDSTVIKNCSNGERITISHPVIESSNSGHDIASDFNYVFPKLSNTFYLTRNTFTFSLPCDVAIIYRPLAKLGV